MIVEFFHLLLYLLTFRVCNMSGKYTRMYGKSVQCLEGDELHDRLEVDKVMTRTWMTVESERVYRGGQKGLIIDVPL